MIKKLLITITTILTCLLPVAATSIPTQDSSIYVNDYADVLSSDTESALVSLNQDSDFETGGYVVVATFDFVDDDLYDFSYKLFNQWGIGDEDNDNGVLLVLDIGNDNYCYILGTGIEKVLSDSEARTIIDEYMEPDFAKQDYDNAVVKTTKQFLDVIENGNFTVDDSIVSNENYITSPIIGVMLGGMFIVGAVALIIIIVVIISFIPRGPGYRRYRGTPPPPYHRPMRGPGPMVRPGRMGRPSGMRRPGGMGGFGSRPSGGFGGSRGGSHHSGGSSRGAGGTRH